MGGAYGRDLKRLLVKHGCQFVRQGKGDHEIWFSPMTNLNFAVDSSTRKRHTVNAILKNAGISEKL